MIQQANQQDLAITPAQLDQAQLADVVGRLFGEPVTVQNWQVSLLGGLDSSPMAGGVYKVSGTAVTRCQIQLDWDVVIKVLRSPAGLTLPDGTTITREMADNEQHFGYWRREVNVADSKLDAGLPAGLRIPRCLGVTKVNEAECWLWQEFINPDPVWKWSDYQEAAYRLGKWQGKGRPQKPVYPWLTRQWLAGWVHGPLTNIFGFVAGSLGGQHPFLGDYFSASEINTLEQLWTGRQQMLDRLTLLPQTLCHLDAHRGNMIWQRNDLVLLDWAFVGFGALGEELAGLVGGSLLLDYVSMDEAETLEAATFTGYIAGLRDSGWDGDMDQIWSAYRCALPLRYAHASLADMLRTVLDPDFAAEWERKTNRPLSDILRHRAAFIRFLLSRVERPVLKQLNRPTWAPVHPVGLERV